MANVKRLSSAPLNDPDTGKPMVYEFDMDVPDEAREYVRVKQDWQAKAKMFRKANREVFRLDQNSPEATMLREQSDVNLRYMPHGVPTAAGIVGENLGQAAGTVAPLLIGQPELMPVGRTAGGLAGAYAGGDLGARMVGMNPRAEGTRAVVASGLGRAAAAGLRAGGTALMKSGLNPPAWLNERFPATWRTAMRERLGLASPRTVQEGLAETGIPGAERASVGERLLGNQSGLTGSFAAARKEALAEERVQALLQRAQKPVRTTLSTGLPGMKGAKIDLEKDVLPEVRRRLVVTGSTSRKPMGRLDETVEIDKIINEIWGENPAKVDLVRAHQLKRGAQEMSADLLEQIQSIRSGGGQVEATAELRERVARELNAVMLDRLRATVPGYRAAEARVTDLMGLRRAFRFREAQQAGGPEVRAGMGGALRFDPSGLLPEHMRTTLARHLGGPTQTFARTVPYPVAYGTSPLTAEEPKK